MSRELIKINNASQPSYHDANINAGQVVGTRANTDDAIIALWISTKRSEGTRRQYTLTIHQFLNAIGNLPIQSISLEDFTGWISTLDHLKPTTRNQRVSIVKSLFTFAHRLGYVLANIGATVQTEGIRETLNERYLTEEQVLRMVMAAGQGRDALLIRVLYRTGGRISEIINARWIDLSAREGGGQLTLFGKGQKSRTVLISADLYADLQEMRKGADDNDRMFNISRQQAWSIIKNIARIAGITDKISPHWLRHAHATHALENDAPLKLVSETLGHASIAITDRYLHARPDDSSGEYLKVG